MISYLITYWLLLFIWKKLCSQHQPKKLSISAIQPIAATSKFANPSWYCGVNGPSHQKANANLNIRSSLPRFCFMLFASLKFQHFLLIVIILNFFINDYDVLFHLSPSYSITLAQVPVILLYMLVYQLEQGNHYLWLKRVNPVLSFYL